MSMTTKNPSVAHHAQAYSQLVTCFNDHRDDVFEFEILPSALQDPNEALMSDGTSYGTSKKNLAAAFIHARQVFFQESEGDREKREPTVDEASKVMLLFDPEHLTAANFRKRVLLRAESQVLFRQELNFLTSILTSPLHRHAKSPTLWSQRVWVMEQILPKLAKSSAKPHFLESVERELDIVMKASERHPTNYYAWSYARKLFGMLEALYLHKETYEWSPDFLLFIISCTDRIKRWCMKHPSDTSGWSFLHRLLPLLATEEARQDVIEDVLEYAVHLCIGNQSLWIFIRTVLADGTLAKGNQIQLNQKVAQLSLNVPNTKEASNFYLGAEQAFRWMNKHQNPR